MCLCLVQRLAAGTAADFRQAANNDPGFGLGNTHWVSSIIQDNNSAYYESMSVLERLLLTGVTTTAGNHHSLIFRHQFTKGGIHGYDFLTSYAQAQGDNAAALGVTIVVNPCGIDIGPPSSLAMTCSALHAGPNSADVAVPVDPFLSKDGSVAARIGAYEAGHGPRTIRILGDAPLSNAVLTVCHDVPDGGDTSDSFAIYALTWDSAAANILIEMAGHLSISGDGTGETWGSGLGSGFLSGGSYHFKLDSLAGALTDNNCPPGQNQKEIVGLGSQDNQLRSSSGPLPPPPCHVTGPSHACPGSTNTYQAASFGPNLTYAWSIAGDGSLLGPTTSSNVAVLAGASGSYTVSVTLTVTSGPLTTNSTCSLPVAISPPPPCSIVGPSPVCPSSINSYSGPDGMASYAWSIAGMGGIPGSVDSQTINVASGSGCNTNFVLTLTVVDANGCFKICNQSIIVQDITPPMITCPASTNAAESPRFSGGAIVSYPPPTATDNCTASPAIFSSPLSGSLFPVGTNIVVGTAVDDCSNSNSCNFIVRVIPYQLLVTSTNDSGPGSLRQALLDGNDSPDENLVVFSLPGAGPYKISLLSALPEVTSPTIIDGWSQSASNAPPVIELDGSSTSNAIDGLVMTVGSNTIRGLAFHGFGTAIRLANQGGNVVQGCFIGTDLTGTNAAGNFADGLYISSPGNLVGGTAPGAGNIISGNGSNGVVIASINASNNLLQGNLIGVSQGGVLPLGNGGNGVFITDQASGNLIGGTNSGSSNTIGFNGKTGITLSATAGTGNGVLGNPIFSNARLGIDLGGDGVTPNDPGDSDTGPNDYQNFPNLSDVRSIQGTTTIFGSLTSLPNTIFRIEFYLSDSADPSGFFEGQTLIGSTYVATLGNGVASFAAAFPLTATYTQSITATATDPHNNTSEFSPAGPVRTPPILGAGPVSTNIPVGNTAAFCVTATGTPPILYQWRLNGFNIPGATDACYTVPTAQVGQGGTYTVVVGNALDAVATFPATMTLNLTRLPAGTNFAGRVSLTGTNGLITGDNFNGISEPGEPVHAGEPGGKPVWYTWTAPVTGVVTMQTAGSTFDTLLAVYTGNALSNLVAVASDEGHGGFYTSLVRFNAFQGTQYRIAIDGFGGDTGDFILSWLEQNTSHLLPIFVVQPTSQTVAPGQNATFTSLAARVCGNGQTNCNEPNTQLFYQWAFYGNPIAGATTNTFTITNVQPAQVGIYTVAISTPYQTNQSRDSVLQINSTDSGTENAKATDKLLDATQAVILGNASAQFIAGVAGDPDPGPKAATIVRGYTGTQIFNTTGSAASPGEVICGVIGGASEWVSFVAEQPGTLFLNTDGSSYDTVMAVYSRSPSNPAVLQLQTCDNNSGANGHSSAVSLPVTQGTTNYIVVDGVNGISGILQLNYSLATTAIIKALGRTAQNAQHLQVVGRPDLHFSIQASTDLVNWTSLITTTNSPTGVFDYFDNDSVNMALRYYRALLLP